MTVHVRIPAEELAEAPRVWLRNGAGPRVRVIDPSWYRRAMARARERAREAAGEPQPVISQALIDAYRAPVGPCAKIIARIAEIHGVTSSDILGPSRVTKIKQARFHAAYEMRQQGHSLLAVGRALKRDHSTISHAVKEWPKLAAKLGFDDVSVAA